MIHQVRLSEITRIRLNEIVRLQQRLLLYAASEGHIDATGCAAFLETFHDISSRGQQIARWVWKKSTRCNELERFSLGTAVLKQEFYQRLLNQIQIFESGNGLLEAMAVPERTREYEDQPESLKGAWKFLKGSYDDLCDTGFPSFLFSPSDAGDFRRQDFLKAFERDNRRLYVCAVCDESAYETSVDGEIRTEIEHYFPKSLYPHFACHPLNLIPICHLCNSAVHGSADPLDAGANSRHNLEDIFLPYRELGLRSTAYLSVEVGATRRRTRLGPLAPLPQIDLRQRLVAFRRIYRIPDRWNEKRVRIGDNLFRRIRQFVKVHRSPVDDDSLVILLEEIHRLLNEDSQGKEPYGFAMIWWLVALIKVEKGRREAGQQLSPLMREIKNFCGLR
jgi:hypothetical protein